MNLARPWASSAASAGEDLIRPQLCSEALRLGRILAGLIPDEAEVHGLLGLMELQASRLNARTGSDGMPLTLEHRNRADWDGLLISRGLAALGDARRLGGHSRPYALQAALAACHAQTRSFKETDWPRIAALYDMLRAVMPSPVVDLNRAVAYSMAEGPEQGLLLLEVLGDEPGLQSYMPLHAARGDLLLRAGRKEEARQAFEQAAVLSRNATERRYLRKKVGKCLQG